MKQLEEELERANQRIETLEKQNYEMQKKLTNINK